MTIALLDEPVCYSQAEAGVFTGCFGGEKRFKNVLLCFLIHADSGIGYFAEHVPAGRYIAAPAVVFFHGCITGHNRQHS